MLTPERGRLKRRDITLNPLSEEWIRRKATPFGVRFLEGRNPPNPRPNYTKQVFLNGQIAQNLQIHPFALLSTKLPIRKLLDEVKKRNSLPFPLSSSKREVMGAQLASAKRNDIDLNKGMI